MTTLLYVIGIYIYIYIERENCICMYVCIYIYTCIYIHEMMIVIMIIFIIMIIMIIIIIIAIVIIMWPLKESTMKEEHEKECDQLRRAMADREKAALRCIT